MEDWKLEEEYILVKMLIEEYYWDPICQLINKDIVSIKNKVISLITEEVNKHSLTKIPVELQMNNYTLRHIAKTIFSLNKQLEKIEEKISHRNYEIMLKRSKK